MHVVILRVWSFVMINSVESLLFGEYDIKRNPVKNVRSPIKLRSGPH